MNIAPSFPAGASHTLNAAQRIGIINSRRWRKEIKTGARFWARVTRREGCWEWDGYHDPNGYAKVTFLQNPTYAHRVAYELMYGKIARGLVIDHLCDNRSCVNPSHMRATNQRTNILRGTGRSAKNAAKEFCIRGHPFSGVNLKVVNDARQCRTCINNRRRKGNGQARGENHPDAKLTESNVRFIREHYRHAATKVLAAKFGISTSNIHSIGKRRSWRHL